jgi:hypothetical protein
LQKVHINFDKHRIVVDKKRTPRGSGGSFKNAKTESMMIKKVSANI